MEIQRNTDELGNETGTIRIAASTSVEEHPVSFHSAEELQKLKDVHPELLDLYRSEVKIQADHRRAMERDQQRHQHALELEERTYRTATTQGMLSLARRGQTLAFGIGTTGLLVSALLGYNGHDWLAGTIGTTSVLTLAGAFLNQFGPGGKGKLPNVSPTEDGTGQGSDPKRALTADGATTSGRPSSQKRKVAR